MQVGPIGDSQKRKTQQFFRKLIPVYNITPDSRGREINMPNNANAVVRFSNNETFIDV
jgi:hypothetical protein